MQENEVRIVVPEPELTLLSGERDDLPEIIVLNEALLTFPHRDIFPWHLAITLQAQDLVENGMPSEDESRILNELGDTIEEAVLGGRTEHNGKNALFLARSTWNGLRELLYQVHNPAIAHASLQELLDGREWLRPWAYEMSGDPGWEKAGYVFGLFPRAQG